MGTTCYATIAVLVRYIHTVSVAAERMNEHNDVHSRLAGLNKRRLFNETTRFCGYPFLHAGGWSLRGLGGLRCAGG